MVSVGWLIHPPFYGWSFYRTGRFGGNRSSDEVARRLPPAGVFWFFWLRCALCYAPPRRRAIQSSGVPADQRRGAPARGAAGVRAPCVLPPALLI